MKHQIMTSIIAVSIAALTGSLVLARADYSPYSSLALPTPTPVRSTTRQRTIKAEYNRLLELREKLSKIPMERLKREPYKSLIERNQNDIVYSEPAGQWLVVSDRFWDLSRRSKTPSISDDIAWTAAQNPLPGECEGFVNCNVSTLNLTYGRYLNTFPRGRHSLTALSRITKRIGDMVGDLGKGSGWSGPTDAADKTELQTSLTEILRILATVPGSGKNRPIALAKKLADAYK